MENHLQNTQLNQQEDFNEFMRIFLEASKVTKSFKSRKGQIEEELYLIPELPIEHTDSIETVEKLYSKEAIIRKKPVNGVEGQVLATISNFNKLEYSITDENSYDGKKIRDILKDIIKNNLYESLSSLITKAGFVFESTNTTISIKENSDPSFFSIPIKKTQFVDNQATKNKKAIKFNDKFNIGDKEFELTDIIMHSGEGSDSGHYYTISKREIVLSSGQKHTAFLRYDDDKTICFMKLKNEIKFVDIKDVENELKSSNNYPFATLLDIKKSQEIEQNFTNIIYQKKIPSSKINETYTGLNNYGNSCYINSLLAFIAGMNEGSEKTSFLEKLKKQA